MTGPFPYGAWPSPITAEMLATAGVGLGEPLAGRRHRLLDRAAPDRGRSRGGVQGRPAHRAGRRRRRPGFDARTRVHEYGGGAYTVHRGTVYFSNRPDHRLYRQVPRARARADHAGDRRAAPLRRRRVTPDGRSWIGVRERHDLGPAVADVVNELVAVPTDGSAEPRVLASGRDFYSAPRISPDGSGSPGSTWDLPWMPWDGTELLVGDLSADGSSSASRSSSPAGRRGVDLAARSGARRASCLRVAIAAAGGTSSGAAGDRAVCTAARPSSAARSGSSASARTRSWPTAGSSARTTAGASALDRAARSRHGRARRLDLPHDALGRRTWHRRGGLARSCSSPAPRPARRAGVARLHEPGRRRAPRRAPSSQVDPAFFSVRPRRSSSRRRTG